MFYLRLETLHTWAVDSPKHLGVLRRRTYQPKAGMSPWREFRGRMREQALTAGIVARDGRARVSGGSVGPVPSQLAQ